MPLIHPNTGLYLHKALHAGDLATTYGWWVTTDTLLLKCKLIFSYLWVYIISSESSDFQNALAPRCRRAKPKSVVSFVVTQV